MKSPSSLSSYYLLEGPEDGMYAVYVQAFVNEYYYDVKPWTEFVNTDNSLCADYSQDDDASDKGQWRIPNQRELMLIRDMQAGRSFPQETIQDSRELKML